MFVPETFKDIEQIQPDVFRKRSFSDTLFVLETKINVRIGLACVVNQVAILSSIHVLLNTCAKLLVL